MPLKLIACCNKCLLDIHDEENHLTMFLSVNSLMQNLRRDMKANFIKFQDFERTRQLLCWGNPEFTTAHCMVQMFGQHIWGEPPHQHWSHIVSGTHLLRISCGTSKLISSLPKIWENYSPQNQGWLLLIILVELQLIACGEFRSTHMRRTTSSAQMSHSVIH